MRSTTTRLLLTSSLTLWALPAAQCSDSEESCMFSPRDIVSDACASYATLDRVNRDIQPALEELTRTTDFFSHYRLNLFHKKCPFWDDEAGMCGNQACAVLTLDSEDDIPEVWRARELSKLEGPHARHPGRKAQRERPHRPLQGSLGDDVGESCVVEYDDECDERDYCVPEDESATSKGDYVSLLQNPERFTGYAGVGARQVWDAIYRENCFQRSSFPESAGLGISQWTGTHGHAAQDFRVVLEALGRQQALEQRRRNEPATPFVAETGLELLGDECLEKRVFHRVISGMHASISTHLCWDFFNQTTGEWHPHPECFRDRLERHPERISNLYFNYALVTRAVAKLGPHLLGGAGDDSDDHTDDYTFCAADALMDADTRAKVAEVTRRAAAAPPLFDEGLMFKNGEGPSLREDFRQRFRNVSRLMDCVGCDKCRLWGKLQTAGYGTALKVLFELDSRNSHGDSVVLKRTELVALFNTYARISSSVNNVGRFQRMLAAIDGKDGTDEEGGKGGKEKQEKREEKLKAAESRHNTQASQKETVRITSHKPEQTEQAEHSDQGETGDESEPQSEGQAYTESEIFNAELELVIKATKLILNRWLNLPWTIWAILTNETTRLLQYWVGLPVTPRTWEFRVPSVDEL